ncbi:hypothetical protein ESZ50_02810 [Weissella muntiaci]|uniref:Type I restriction enzyme R protein C-terminal domain-containing protein n=1 Tax=Weissella muntiaci TaxID=2508881 RepID=A0A6C2C8N5_9LACO|nr:hypothetical protein ESZ50_02810 [Weissella muntiaci]
MQQYYEFSWEGIGDKRLPFSEETWLKYVGAYRNLSDPTELGEADDPEELGDVKLVDTQVVTFDEIIRLIGKVAGGTGSQMDDNQENLRLINEAIMKLRSYGDKDNADLLQRFMNEIVDHDLLEAKLTIEENYRAFVAEVALGQLEVYAIKWGVQLSDLERVYRNYEIGSDHIDYIGDLKANSQMEESEWDNLPDNDGKPAFLKKIQFKTVLQDDVTKWLYQTKTVYGELN